MLFLFPSPPYTPLPLRPCVFVCVSLIEGGRAEKKRRQSPGKMVRKYNEDGVMNNGIRGKVREEKAGGGRLGTIERSSMIVN